MAKKGKGSGWHGEPVRHKLAGMGFKTVLPDGRRLDVSNFVANGKSYNVMWAESYDDIEDFFYKNGNFIMTGAAMLGLTVEEFRAAMRGELDNAFLADILMEKNLPQVEFMRDVADKEAEEMIKHGGYIVYESEDKLHLLRVSEAR